MKIIITNLLLIYITIFELNAQESNASDGIFADFDQFKSETPCQVKSIAFKNKSELLLEVNDIVSDCTGYKKINKIIAIQYDKEIYYNMRFNVEFMTKNKFSKLLVKGKYCAFLVDESYPMNIQRQAGFNSGGLMGAIIRGPNGNNKIYYLDIDTGYKTKILTKKRLKELLNVNKELLDSFNKEENISAELFLNYLEKLNQKLKKE